MHGFFLLLFCSNMAALFRYRMQHVLLLFYFALVLTDLVHAASHHKAEIEDNEFAEFEEFDEEEEIIPKEEENAKFNSEAKVVPSAAPSFDDDVQIEVCLLMLFTHLIICNIFFFPQTCEFFV